VKWEGDKLTLEFDGNRIDALASPGGERGTSRVLIDRKKPSEFPELYYHARPSGTANIGWSAIERIGREGEAPAEPMLLLEQWTLTCTGFNDKADDFRFTLVGSKTGPDGSGASKQRFVSTSSRVVIEPEDWVFEYDRAVSKKPTPDGFQVRWQVKPLFTDTFEPPEVKDPTREYSTLLAQGLPNARHKLELIGKAAIQALRVHKPPHR